MLSELFKPDWWIQQTEVWGNVLPLPWRCTCSCWQTSSPLCCLLLDSSPMCWPQNRYRGMWAAECHRWKSPHITLKGRFWVAVAAVCSPSFHLSISFSAPVLLPVSPGPGWRYSDWYTVDSRQLIPGSVSAIQSCSSCFFTPSPKGY